jgi:uncharacterized protein involved in outer membrane biogenesis
MQFAILGVRHKPTSMKRFKKILKITGITLLVLIALAFLIPIIFKKQITNLVKKEINKSINAKVDFSDVSLSLFRRFPRVSIQIKDLSVVGINEFANDTLLYSKKLDGSANLFSVIKGSDIKVSGIFLESPRILAKVTKEGKANWDIAKASTDTSSAPDTDTSASEFKMTLKKYSIHNGYIVYDDRSSDTYFKLDGIDHEGSGDITADVFTLKTKTEVTAASFMQGTIPYLTSTKTEIETDIEINNKTSTYTFKTDDIALNDLKLSAEGSFTLTNDSTYDMDIKFKSPSNEFKDILSLIPAIYKQDFDKIKTSGKAEFNGFVKGRYSPQQIPAYDIKLAVKDGMFQYPDLPKPVKNIQIDLHASNPDGLPDNAVIDISKGHLEMDNEPFDFRFLFKNPETIQYIDATAKGKLDLSQLAQFIKLEGGTKLAGLVWADAYAKGNMSAMETQSGPFTAGGFFDIKNLYYSSKDFPQPIQNGNMKVQFTNNGGVADNTTVDISNAHIEVGKDPVDFALQLSQPMSAVNFNGAAKGRLTLDNLKQFGVLEPNTSLTGVLNADVKFAGNKTLIDQGDYDKINITGTANLANVKYTAPEYPGGIAISSAAANFNISSVTITQFNGNYLNSNFSGNGTLNNLIGFAMKNEPLKGNVSVSVDKMNLNDWTGTASAAPVAKTGAPGPESAPFLVPANLDIQLNAKAGQVIYDNVQYNNINGALQLSDETVKLQNVKADALQGSITVNGDYSTKNNKTKPEMGLSYIIKDMDVQQAFMSYNTIQSLMPIGKFLSGKLNSELTMTGNLNGDMMPNLASLSGKGNLLLIEGVLKKFGPLEKLASALSIDRLKTISVKDIKNYIEFANGKVLVKPFTIKVEDIEMQIGGLHGFDQSIDYSISMKVPRKYLGNAGNNLINGLASAATSKGIPVKLGDIVDLNVKMGGSINNPSIKIDLQKVAGDAMSDLKEQAKDFAKEKIDSVKQKVTDTLNVIKDKVKETVKDKLKEQLFGKDTAKKNDPAKPDTVKKTSTGTEVKNKLKDLFGRPKKPATDTIKKQ